MANWPVLGMCGRGVGRASSPANSGVPLPTRSRGPEVVGRWVLVYSSRASLCVPPGSSRASKATFVAPVRATLWQSWSSPSSRPLSQHGGGETQVFLGSEVFHLSIPAADSLPAKQHTLCSGDPVNRWDVQRWWQQLPTELVSADALRGLWWDQDIGRPRESSRVL